MCNYKHHYACFVVFIPLSSPSHSSSPPLIDFRHHYWTAALRLWPSQLHGGDVFRQQAVPGVDAELPEIVRERDKPPLLHLPGPVQRRGGAGKRQQRQRGVHHAPDARPALCGSHGGAHQQLVAQPLHTWLGRQHTGSQ